jgi:hypothetical protein
MSVYTSRSVYVDALQGNDSSGKRQQFDLPYQTITAALAVAQPGDTVFVRPGMYNERNLLKNGVDIFGPGADVISTDATEGAVFDDSSNGANAACVSTITLRDIIRKVSPPYIGARKYPVIRIANANSNLIVRCRRIENFTYKATQVDGSTADPCCILTSAGRGLFYVDDYIRSRFYDALLSYTGANGDMTVNADSIVGGYYAELGDPDNVHGYYADGAASLVETESLNFGEGGELNGTGAIWRVYARRWGSNNSYGVSLSNAILYANIHEDIFGANEAFITAAAGGLCHVRARELRSTAEEAVAIAHAGNFWFYGTNFYADGTNKAAATVVTGATMYLKQGCALNAHSGAANSITGAGAVKAFNGTEANKPTTGVTVSGAVTTTAALV